uniref:Uncharacterized protein n=1 Tax=Alexandrium catenella TaxID=2925 RepID=A0A7S1LBA3_ALECA|mmetsp:Transcript_110220/g.292725  ORF Transcript_110220/g.292725 Transcript_110220/m.292725 type:complete len:129 (+) Transcript_110220:113-499(+)|eukprot:CAMPEP_0171183110 /NCGR_PEP_ID=MMETSP0790-20130122/15112_1 /TAXON_ID=2925 /ORGANISM="Alexandrium catenella, Strain OF101" /LENGTH=128 /DNA_ID=CAMNT_0011648081 /DNA_START=113 /DNA_END=499 /DNA_ORIENTATION=-
MSASLLQKLTLKSDGEKATVPHEIHLGWAVETVLVHTDYGPLVLKPDGSYGFMALRFTGWNRRNGKVGLGGKAWSGMSSTEKKVAITVTAKANAMIKDRLGDDFFAGAKLPGKQQIKAAVRAMGGRDD